jgi:hypothetical protein
METPKRTRVGHAASEIAFYLVAIVVVIVLGVFTAYLNGRRYVIYPIPDAAPITKALSRAQDAHAAVGNLLTTLATGLVAAFGLFLTRTPKNRLSSAQLSLAGLSIFSIFISLYFGFVASQNLIWALEYSIASLDIPKLQWPRLLQFYSLIAGVFFVADFVRRDLRASE